MIAEALSFVPAILQGAQAIKQNKLAKNLKMSDYIPPSILEAEQRSRAAANATEVPGEAAARARLERQTANTTNAVRTAAKDSTTVLDKLQEADAVAKAKATDIEAQAQEFRYRNQKALEQTLNNKAAYEQRNRDSYDAAKSALKGAAAQNAFNAFQNATSAAIMMNPDKEKSTIDTSPEMQSIGAKPLETTASKVPTTLPASNIKVKSPYYRDTAPEVMPYKFMGIN